MEEKQRYQVIVSDRAKQMLGVQIRFMAQTSKPAAIKTKNSLIQAMCSLQELPQRYPFLDTEHITRNKYHKMFVEKWYLVLYQIRDTTVFVDYILDCRQDYGWLLG